MDTHKKIILGYPHANIIWHDGRLCLFPNRNFCIVRILSDSILQTVDFERYYPYEDAPAIYIKISDMHYASRFIVDMKLSDYKYFAQLYQHLEKALNL